MVNKKIGEWDFVKQCPKNQDVTTLGSDNQYVIGYQNGVIDSSIYISDGNTTIHNLTVTGSLELPPREGDMRTVLDEDGYWLTQVYRVNPINEQGNVWWTINRTESIFTFTPTQRVSIWSKIKKFFKS